MKRQHWLILLVLALVAALVYAVSYDPYQPQTGVRSSGTSASSGGGRHPAAHEVALQLELLERQEKTVSEVKRDIFHFYTPPAPVAPPPPVIKKPLPAPPPPVVKAAPPPAPAPVHGGTRFTFLGLMDKEDQRSVFLSSGDDLFVVKEGMRFGKQSQFRVETISDEEISIKEEGLASLTRITLQGAEEPQSIMAVPKPTASGSHSGPLRFSVPAIQHPKLKSFKRHQP